MLFRRKLSAEARVEDLLLIGSVPVALLVVYALPDAAKQSLVLSFADPTPVTVYASHFVHFDFEHLLVNVTSYTLLVPTTYALAVLGGRRIRFRVAFVAIPLAVPFALSWLNVLVAGGQVGYGFSGVAMGYLALLGLELFNYVEVTLQRSVSSENAVMLFFAEVALISVAVAQRTEITLPIAVVSAAVAAVYGWQLVRGATTTGVNATGYLGNPGFAELGGVALALSVAFPFVMFPPSAGNSDGVLNLYMHLLGYCLVFVAAYVLPPVERTHTATR